MDRANRLYPSSYECLIILYDLQFPGKAERLDRECAGWGGSAHVEQLDARYAVLVIRPGGALLGARW